METTTTTPACDEDRCPLTDRTLQVQFLDGASRVCGLRPKNPLWWTQPRLHPPCPPLLPSHKVTAACHLPFVSLSAQDGRRAHSHVEKMKMKPHPGWVVLKILPSSQQLSVCEADVNQHRSPPCIWNDGLIYTDQKLISRFECLIF